MSKKRPIDRSEIYPFFQSKMQQIVDKVPCLSEDIRKELDMWEYQFTCPLDRDLTEEEKKLKEDE